MQKITLYHPDLDRTISVPTKAARTLRKSGWQVAFDNPNVRQQVVTQLIESESATAGDTSAHADPGAAATGETPITTSQEG